MNAEEIAGKVMEGNPFSIGNRKVDLKTAAELGISSERERFLGKLAKRADELENDGEDRRAYEIRRAATDISEGRL